MLPRGDEYNQAIQNPHIAFLDPELKKCRVETNALGLPKPYSGGFTTTYHMIHNSQEWAVRCFTREISDLPKRYSEIGNFINSNGSSKYFINASYLVGGINIDGNRYPIIKMDWMKGDPLNVYLSKIYKNKTELTKLSDNFKQLVQYLESKGVAHGDLQHGNILVKNGNLYLIDYDGIYLPQLSHLATNEIGHPNYQHPERSKKDFNSKIDRFSSILIYVAIQVLITKPDLWNKYDSSENLLFKQKDFLEIEDSNLFYEISNINSISSLVDRFKGVCRLNYSEVPSLDVFISGNFAYPKVKTSKPKAATSARSPYLIISATNSDLLRRLIGNRVEVIGKIGHSFSGHTKYGTPYLFLNFGGAYPYHSFTVVLWSEIMDQFILSGINPGKFVNSWVSVIGVISSYNGRAQMEIELINQVQVLTKTDAENRINGLSSIQRSDVNLNKQSSILTHTTGKISSNESAILNKLYKNYPAQKPVIRSTQSPPRTIKNPISSKVSKKSKNYTPGIIWGGILGAIFITSIFKISIIFGIIIGAIIGALIVKIMD